MNGNTQRFKVVLVFLKYQMNCIVKKTIAATAKNALSARRMMISCQATSRKTKTGVKIIALCSHSCSKSLLVVRLATSIEVIEKMTETIGHQLRLMLLCASISSGVLILMMLKYIMVAVRSIWRGFSKCIWHANMSFNKKFKQTFSTQ